MFEDISYTFQQCGCFFVFGVLMGLCYECPRILRIIFKHNVAAVFIEDLLFFSLFGFFSFVLALWIGIGYFRIYYIVFELLGACCYFLTLGKLVNLLSRRLLGVVKNLFCTIYKKIKPKLDIIFSTIAQFIKPVFGNIADFFGNVLLKGKKVLQSPHKKVYNSKNQADKRGENSSGNTIKAQIRKKA